MEPQRGAARQPEILICGAGCTGALVAALLRREAACRGGSMAPKVTVWEWGRGPAGRMSSFWAEVGGVRALADMGAQVISVRDDAAMPEWLLPHLRPAEPAGLARTPERGADWRHFHAPAGLASLQRASLEAAAVEELHFSRRVVELAPVGSRWRAGYGAGRRATGFGEFDAVVFAGTSRDAEGLEGLRRALSPEQQRALGRVGYDHRMCVGLVLKPALDRSFDALCKGKAEVSFEEGAGSILSLVSRQEVKGRNCSEQACVVVLHSTNRFAAENLQAAKQANKPPVAIGARALSRALADLLGMSARELEAATIDSKTVHWRQCQVRQAFHSTEGGPPGCLVAASAPNLILAGDYLAEPVVAGSFEGCLESARAAASATCDLLLGPSSGGAAPVGPRSPEGYAPGAAGAGAARDSASKGGAAGQKGAAAGKGGGRWRAVPEAATPEAAAAEAAAAPKQRRWRQKGQADA